ncbi:MAG: methyltransferase domain-containing protein [Candidatus Acidiferrales bacterium]
MIASIPPNMEGTRALSQYGIVVCDVCNTSDWHWDGDENLRCLTCHTRLPIEGKVLDCLSRPARSTSTIEQWNVRYEEEASKLYSERKDWWTLSSWKRHLFRSVLPDLRGKFVLDIGCGTAVRVATLAPIDAWGYTYVGIDSSLEALKAAAGNIPGGVFILANLDALRLRPASADVVLCLGVLMYFADSAKLLDKILNVLKPGGVLLLHEQVSRRRWGQIAQGAFPLRRERHSDAWGVPRNDLQAALRPRGRVLHAHGAGSPWRKLFMNALDNSSLERLRPTVAWFDSAWCATIGRILPDVGASEVHLVFRKN